MDNIFWRTECEIQLTGAGGNKGNAESPMEPVVPVYPLIRDGQWSCFGSNCACQVHRLDLPRLKLCQPDREASTFLLTEGSLVG